MIISPAGIELIKEFEKLKLNAYQDSGGVWTIGYGHTGSVHKAQQITREQADKYLVDDLRSVSSGVTAALHVPVQQCQFDAFCAFAFNVGVQAFAGSTMLKKFLAGQDCTAEFMRWVHDGGVVVPGLGIRRMAERLLFMHRDWRVVI